LINGFSGSSYSIRSKSSAVSRSRTKCSEGRGTTNRRKGRISRGSIGGEDRSVSESRASSSIPSGWRSKPSGVPPFFDSVVEGKGSQEIGERKAAVSVAPKKASPKAKAGKTKREAT